MVNLCLEQGHRIDFSVNMRLQNEVHCTDNTTTKKGTERHIIYLKGNNRPKTSNTNFKIIGMSKRSVVQPANLMTSLWTNFLIICLCAFVCTNAQSYGVKIEASNSLFDLDLEKLDELEKIDDVSQISTKFDGHEENDEIGGRNFHLFAVTGHVFNRSIAEELKLFDKGVISDGDIVKVHFPRSALTGSEWLMFREDFGLLQGVPLPRHEGLHKLYVIITHTNKPSQSSLTLPCTVEVVTEEGTVDLRQKLHRHPRFRIDIPYRCPHHEPVAVAAIRVSVNSSALTPSDRLQCLLGLSTFLGISTKDVTMHTSTDSMKNDRPFMSGPGNVAKIRTHRGEREVTDSITLSWPLGCSSDIIGDIPGLDKLETTALDGSLAQAIGHDVMEWQIVNRMHHVRRVHRTKRQVGDVPSSSGIYYPPAYPKRSADDMYPGETDEIDLIRPIGSRARVAANMIRPSAVVGIPIMASKTPSPPLTRDQNFRPPSTPSIMSPGRTRTPPPPGPPSNEAPMMLFGMENVYAIEGTYMEFRIPQDTFIDKEEGMTRNLELQILDLTTNEFIQNDGKWPLFDQKAQLLYGVPDITASPEREYMLAAKDSGGKSGSITFTIYVDHKHPQKPASHKYTFIFSEYPKFEENEDMALYSSFGRKLTVALAKSENMPGVLSMVKYGSTKNGERMITWFDRDFNDATSCQSVGKGIKEEANIMIGKDASTGRNKPAKEFAAKFKPEYKLKWIKIDLLGPCESHTTTTITPPETTTTTTTTTTTSTAATTLKTSTTSKPIIEPPMSTSTVRTAAPTTLSSTTTSSSTTSMATKTESSTKTSVKPDMPTPEMRPKLGKSPPKLQTQVGKIIKYVIPDDSFVSTDLDELNYRFAGNAPSWLGVESPTRMLYIMPTQDDFEAMESHNATHRMWKGGIIAQTKDGVDSEPLSLEIFVQEEKNVKEMRANHEFQIKIKNYEPTNFTSNDRIRLIKLICDIFGDEEPSSIYVLPIEKGSVVFSWHNTTLAYIDPCPYQKIATIGSKLFVGKVFDPKVKERFQENNFTVQTVNLKRPSWCKSIPNSASTEKTTTAVDVAIAGKQGKSTTIIIIAVIVVCLVLLIIILVLKCRMGKSAKAKKEEVKEKHEREEAAIAAGNPDMSDTPRIKKGVPIIFQDEIAMEPNGNSHASPATPLIARNHHENGGNRSPAIAEDDQHILEETPFNSPASHPMTPPTPIMSDRPPPPYIKSR